MFETGFKANEIAAEIVFVASLCAFHVNGIMLDLSNQISI
jgi:hypothetical protein